MVLNLGKLEEGAQWSIVLVNIKCFWNTPYDPNILKVMYQDSQ